MHGLSIEIKKRINMCKVNLLDCTLRDGGYINQWKFGKDTITGILERLSISELDIIECGFLTEKTKTDDYTLFSDARQVNSYIKTPNPNTLYVAMIAIGEKEINPEKLCDASESVIGGIRLTFHMSELKKAIDWAAIIIRKGYKLFMQPVGSGYYDDSSILELIKKANHIKPYAFYIVDTLGAMREKDILHMMHIIDKNLDESILLGFHSHNNLQMSFSNAQRMINFGFERDIIIDCSVYGMGRGAGNTCTELMVDYLHKNGDNNYDVLPSLEIVDNYLIPIYLQHRWGYSVAYFLASSLQCHPNYVSYLLEKQNMQVRSISSLLKQIPEKKRLIYYPEIIEQIYKSYQNHAIADRDEILRLRSIVKGKKILVLGSGKSIHSKRSTIEKYIEKNHPFVIAVNFVPDIPVDMYFVANQKRYELFKDKFSADKTVFSSNVKETPKKAVRVNYSDLLNDKEYVFDSSGMMLLRLLIRLKVRETVVAGFDGFKKNYLDNYCDKRFLHQDDSKIARMKNMQMKELIKSMGKEIGIEFITPSKYDEK